MKKFLKKPHNLLFAASAVMLLQFLASVIYYFTQVIINQEVTDLIYYIYIPYYLAVCVISVIFIVKKREENKKINSVKMWFSGFFLYAFCEILIFIKLLFEYENNMEFAYNLFDNQILYKLYLCVSLIFLIYCVSYILEKKRIYAVLAGLNLLFICLFIIFMPDMSEFLLAGDESAFELITIVSARETGNLLFMFNMFIFALCELYNYK